MPPKVKTTAAPPAESVTSLTILVYDSVSKTNVSFNAYADFKKFLASAGCPANIKNICK